MVLYLVVFAACTDEGASREPYDWNEIADCTQKGDIHVTGGGWQVNEGWALQWVCVVDADTDRPIADAEVELADGRGGVTGTNGLVVLDYQITPQLVTVRAPGMVTTTVRTTRTQAITVPLEPIDVRTAIVEGTLRGWAELAPVDAGHHRIARIQATEPLDPTARTNELPEAEAECRWEPSTACAWRLTTRTGRQRVVATILDVDEGGISDDPSDDTATVTGYAMSEPLALGSGQHVTDVALTRVLDAAIAPVVVIFPERARSVEQIAVISVYLGDEGRLRLAARPITPSLPTSRVPVLEGRYDVTERVQVAGMPARYLTRTTIGAEFPEVALAGDARTALPELVSCGDRCWRVIGDDSIAHVVRISRGGRLLWKQIGIALGMTIEPPLDAVAPSDGPFELTVRNFQLAEPLGFELAFDDLFLDETAGAGLTATIAD